MKTRSRIWTDYLYLLARKNTYFFLLKGDKGERPSDKKASSFQIRGHLNMVEAEDDEGGLMADNNISF